MNKKQARKAKRESKGEIQLAPNSDTEFVQTTKEDFLRLMEEHGCRSQLVTITEPASVWYFLGERNEPRTMGIFIPPDRYMVNSDIYDKGKL